MKIVKRLMAAVVVIALICGGIAGLNRLTVSDEGTYARLMMHEFYNQENIDTLVVGASHCFLGIDPEILSEATGTNAFCASTASQRTDASLALVKEALDNYDVDHIYMELSHSIANKTGVIRERTNMTSTWLVYDYMRPSLNRYSFILNASSSDFYMNSFFPARRNWKQAMDPAHLKQVWTVRHSDAYRNFAYDYAVHDTEWYVGKGHVCSNEVMENGQFFYHEDGDPFRPENISADWKSTVGQIIEACRAKGVQLTFFAVPISNYMLAAEGNYDEYIRFIRDYLADSGVDYVDFNLLSESVFPYDPADYLNEDHLNMYGSEKFSRVLGAYMAGKLPDNAFVETVAQKLEACAPEYYGIYSCKNPEKTSQNLYKLVSAQPEQMEYRITLVSSKGEETVVQDFDTNDSFSISRKKHGTMHISCRPVGAPEQLTTVEREY